MWAVERYSRELCHQPRSGCCWHHVLEPEYPKESSWKWPDNNQRPPWVLLQQCFSSLSPGRTCRCWLSSVCYHSYMNGVCAWGSWSISANVTRAINAIALLCMHCYGNDRRSLITSFSIALQKRPLIAYFISFMFKGKHWSYPLSALCLKAITVRSFYQLCVWWRSPIAYVISSMIEGHQWLPFYQLCDWRRSTTICMEERHWSLPLSALCLKAITHHCFDEW